MVRPEDEYYIAILEEDKRYHFDPVTFEKDKNGVLCFDVRAYLKQHGLPHKCAHFKPTKYGIRQDWKKMYRVGRGIAAANGFCMSQSDWFDCSVYDFGVYYSADGMMIYEGQDVHKLKLHWVDKNYYDMQEIREMILKSFECPHVLSKAQVREILARHGDERHSHYFSAR